MAKDKPVTKDERFKGLHSDPRFRLPKKHDFKVKVDDRFSKEDMVMTKSKAKVDKYGRKVEENKDDDFDKYYEKEGESEESESASEDEEEEEEEEESEEESEVDDDDEVAAALDRARGEGVGSDYESSSDESSSDEESDEEDVSDEELELEETKPEAGDPSRRFAVVNLDWDHVKSIDLFATFQSFVPSDGLLENVAIYQSEFGKERMQKEEIEGPPRDLFQSKKKKKAEESDDDSDRELDIKDLIEEGNGDEDYDSKSLRKYQLQRLRYYYAVVTCDSIKTAKAIYDNVDGTEYESTANFFDLRFIPDEMDFDDEPRDTCNKIPSNYKPETFVTDALQHSKVKLTWDETPADRVKLSTKSFSQRELDDMDFQAYLASDNDSDEEAVNDALKNKYRNLVGSSTKIGNKDIFAADENDDDEDDGTGVTISFTPALPEGQTAPKAEGEEESTIDKLKRKAKDRRKARKDKLKEMKKAAEEEKKAGKKEAKKGKKPVVADAKSNAELELLTMGEDDDKKHFSLKELVRSEKEKGKKSKHRDQKRIVEDDFKADLDDARFSEVFTDHAFAIDPTQPEFQKTATMKKILEESNKRRSQAKKGKKDEKKDGKKRKHEEVTPTVDDAKALAQKIKRKMKSKK